ncbi:MAG: HIT domain-containing protein, partial [Dehalococcoidales bacterium]|nr:HIT domain-containing protein [Dehalococcoidales bacterium]
PSLANITDDESPLIGRMAKVANRLAKEAGVSESGYRLVVSSGEDGGQVVPHLHMHLLGGRKLSAGPC